MITEWVRVEPQSFQKEECVSERKEKEHTLSADRLSHMRLGPQHGWAMWRSLVPWQELFLHKLNLTELDSGENGRKYNGIRVHHQLF